MKKLTAIICLVFAIVMLLSLPMSVSASEPYQTYTYSISGTALGSPAAYTPVKAIDGQKMGLSDLEKLASFYPELDPTNIIDGKQLSIYAQLNNPSDIETDDKGNVYIADTDNNRIVVLDRYYKLQYIIDDFINGEGVQDNLTAPKGIFVTSDRMVGTDFVKGQIYICDTNASRIVTFNLDGSFSKVIPAPQSELFDNGAAYKPVSVAVDQYGRLYVVSSSTYQGIIVMTDEGEFTSFVGAQKVVISAWDRIWRRFQSEEQRKSARQYVSTEFNNVTLSGDFIYATTSSIDEKNVTSAINSRSKSGDYAPVKMLNAAGDEIMRRNGFFPPSGEIDFARLRVSDTLFGPSTLVDVAVGPEKTWSVIDQKRSKVFTYDFEGNLLFAFGDKGNQLGNITSEKLSAIVYQGDKMLLLDKDARSFTVYERTEYGNVLIGALNNQNNRRYDLAIEDWKEILKRNANFDTAYIGIGKSYYQNDELEMAIEYYQAAYDTENYSVAFKELRKDWLSKFILLIPVAVIAICVGCSKFLGWAKKVNKRVATAGEKRTYGQEILYAFHVIFHPFDGFWDLKHEKRGSLRAAVTILGALLVAFYYNGIGRGYIVNPQELYNTFFGSVLSVCVPLALWVIGNWCLTTLFDGEGSLKDIFIATCYALVPMILIMIPATIATNFVVAEEVDIVNVVLTASYIWSGMLIFFGMQVTHDYSMGKNILTIFGTLLAMIIIMFIAILFTSLLGKMVSFVTNIVTELQFRL
ncbi:MAG: YIP1 family protein [Clostridia bacterium]|nr:YIP1 family protein [Clostridia bacterium]